MARIRITYETNYVSKQDGYGAWVHVTTSSGDGYAHHAGYYRYRDEAKNEARDAANVIKRAIEFAGKKPIMKEGNHT